MTAETFDFEGQDANRLSGRIELPIGELRGWGILAHCFTCGKDSLAASRIARALASNGIGVLRSDFAGLGAGEGLFGETTFAANVEDLIRACNAVICPLHADELPRVAAQQQHPGRADQANELHPSSLHLPDKRARRCTKARMRCRQTAGNAQP